MEVSTKTKITLTVNEDEAEWLKGVLQNPMTENGDPSLEHEEDKEYRKLWWDAVNTNQG